MEKRELALKAVVGIMRTQAKLVKILKSDIQQYGVNMTEFAVLEVLYHKGEQQMQDICQKILIASSSTTYVVNQLEQKEYVERIRDEADRRIFYVRLTEKGRTLMDEVFPLHAEHIARVFEEVTEEELQITLNTLKAVHV